MHRTKNDLPEVKRREIVALLNEQLADTIDLLLQTKMAHWNGQRPDLHRSAQAVRRNVCRNRRTLSTHARRGGNRALGGTCAPERPALSPARQVWRNIRPTSRADTITATPCRRRSPATGQHARGRSTKPPSWRTPTPPTSLRRSRAAIDKWTWFVKRSGRQGVAPVSPGCDPPASGRAPVSDKNRGSGGTSVPRGPSIAFFRPLRAEPPASACPYAAGATRCAAGLWPEPRDAGAWAAGGATQAVCPVRTWLMAARAIGLLMLR